MESGRPKKGISGLHQGWDRLCEGWDELCEGRDGLCEGWDRLCEGRDGLCQGWGLGRGGTGCVSKRGLRMGWEWNEPVRQCLVRQCPRQSLGL